MSKFIIWIFCLGLFANVLGCSSVGRKSAVVFHDLGVPQVQLEQFDGHTLEVRVDAPLWVDDSRIYYRQLFHDPTAVRFYSLDKWLSRPSEIIRQQMLSIRLMHSMILKIQLLNFEQQFDSPQTAKSILIFNADVYDSKPHQHLKSRKFVFEQYNVSADADGAVQSFSEIMKKARLQVHQWLNSKTLDN